MTPTICDGDRATKGPTLAECLAGRQDNFLLIRLLAAAAVIFGHSYKVNGGGENDFLVQMGWGVGIYTGSVAVEVFFVLSGFLVANSWIRRPHLFAFARARLLRLIPALFVCLVLTALVLGPLVSTLAPADYFRHADTWDYIWRNLSFSSNLRWTLPGVYTDNPYPDIVNGSLWTLPAEMQMYGWLALLGLIGAWRGARIGTLALACIYAMNLIFPTWASQILLQDYVPMAGMFVLGVLFALNAQRIRLNALVLAGLLFACVLLHGTPRWGHIYALTLAYSVFWLAYIPLLPLHWLRGDYSYGLYLWGYPIQQLVAHLLGPIPAPLVFVLSLLLAGLLAVASWHWVESPALRFKRGWRRRPRPALTQASPDS